jgi:signal transduction histidine kinase
MRVTARLPDVEDSIWSPRPDLTGVWPTVRRYRVELLWAAFAAANYAAMIRWPSWETIPFHFVWITLTLLYGFRVWPLRVTTIVLGAVMALTGGSIMLDAFMGTQLWGELFEVPLMAAMFLAMVWHARRRVDALRVAKAEAEERRAMLESQERFIHDASHELRTPLTIARGHLELLADHGLAGEVDVALDELGRMDAIIERLLLLAAAEQPDFLQIGSVELEPFLEDVFMRWSEVAHRTWRLGPLARVELSVDPHRLRAVLDALIENAVKYTDEREAIELRARRAGPNQVLIEVEDEGSGVPEDALARIFERFARTDAARARSTGGVGLGLSIVDAIAKAHGGRCAAQNTGHGSIFSVQLPGATPAQSAQHLPEVSSSSTLTPIRPA